MKQPVKFDRPPVVEVVCGVMFKSIDAMLVPHFGLFWSRLRDSFPQVAERPPIEKIAEGQPALQVEVLSSPPLPRLWFVAADGKTLVQVQRNAFLFNWKRSGPDDIYPAYETIIGGFEKHLGFFCDFVKSEGLGEIEPDFYELTYVNHIPLKSASHGTFEGIFSDHVRDVTRERFLPPPDSYDWRSLFSLPQNAGRLDIVMQTARASSGEGIVRMNLTARGSLGHGVGNARAWFDLAHDWITHGFADATTPEWHEVWGRTQ